MKDLEVYENEIEIYAEDYIKSLANEDDIYKVSTFKGMLKHIFKHVFKVINIIIILRYLGSLC